MSLSLAGGFGLLSGKTWGRIIAILNAALSFLFMPAGTIIGVLAMIYLTRPEVRKYFKGNTDEVKTIYSEMKSFA